MNGRGRAIAIAIAGVAVACGGAARERGAPSEGRAAGSEERVAPSEERGAPREERAAPGEERAAPGVAPERRSEGAAWASEAPEGLVDLRAAIDDLCVDIRYATTNNFTGAVLPGYAVPGAWLREDAALALARAQASLREKGVGLLVYDAYRPRRATKAMVAWAKANGREDLLERGFIAEDSAHARGRTIDVGLCDPNTRAPLDLGTEFDAFVPEARHGAVQGEPGKRRAMLREALVTAGFTPYAREWWHYSMKTETPGAALDVPYGGADLGGLPRR